MQKMVILEFECSFHSIYFLSAEVVPANSLSTFLLHSVIEGTSEHSQFITVNGSTEAMRSSLSYYTIVDADNLILFFIRKIDGCMRFEAHRISVLGNPTYSIHGFVN